MFFCSFWGGGRNGTSTNHFSAVNSRCSVNILRESLYYRMIKLLIKLVLIALLIGLPKTVQLTDRVKKKLENNTQAMWMLDIVDKLSQQNIF